MRKDLLRASAHFELSSREDKHLLRVAGDIVHGMGDEKDRHSLHSVELVDLSEEILPPRGVQPRRRFIQDQDLGAHGENTGDRSSSLLSAGDLKGRLLPDFFGKPHSPERLLRHFLRLFVGKSLIFRPEHDIPKDIRLKELVFRILKDKPYLEAEGLPIEALRLNADLLPLRSLSLSPEAEKEEALLLGKKRKLLPEVHKDLALCGLEQAIEMLHKRRFPGARIR